MLLGRDLEHRNIRHDGPPHSSSARRASAQIRTNSEPTAEQFLTLAPAENWHCLTRESTICIRNLPMISIPESDLGFRVGA